jgi:hypothetical protein
MSGLYSYTIDDIRANFSVKDYVRGQEYARAGRVVDIKISDDGKLIARVQGSGRNLYKIEVQIESYRSKKRFSSDCSCPLGMGCKHIVAALLSAMGYTSSTQIIDVTPKIDTSNSPIILPYIAPTVINGTDSVLDHELHSWLNSLGIEANTAEKEATTPNKLLIYTIEPPKGKEAFIVSPVTTSILKSGMFSSSKTHYRLENTESYNRGKHVNDNDAVILRLISSLISVSDRYSPGFKIPVGA